MVRWCGQDPVRCEEEGEEASVFKYEKRIYALLVDCPGDSLMQGRLSVALLSQPSPSTQHPVTYFFLLQPYELIYDFSVLQ